jgi:hypothetical protein
MEGSNENEGKKGGRRVEEDEERKETNEKNTKRGDRRKQTQHERGRKTVRD